MILALDMGNSNIVVGGIDNNKTYFMERIGTDLKLTDSEYAIQIKSLLDINKIDVSDIDGSILSSVVPPLNTTISNAVKKILGVNPLIVNCNMNTGMKILMDNPASVGCDLIVDSVAAASKYPLPIIVIDMGTATTITVVDKDGNYIGGIIHPGLRVSLESLSNKTAQLPHIDLSTPNKIIAKNTIESMRSGILYGHAGMMDSCIDRMENELGMKATIVATGGLAPFVVPLCSHEIKVDDNLMLEGLYILYQRNV